MPAVTWSPPGVASHRGVLSARVAGEGTPIVLLHGLAGSGRYWGAAFDQLAGNGQLIVPDLPGFGASARPPGPLSAAAHADAVAATLDEIAGPDAAAVVVGHSAGCLVAFTLAGRHPGRVAAVVAFAPPLYADTAAARSVVRGSGLAGRLIALDRRWAWQVLATAHRLRRPAGRLARVLRPHLPAALLHGSLTHTWTTYQETLQSLVMAADPAHAAWLRSTPTPVHLVAGAADRLLDLPYLEHLAASSAVSLSVWPSAAHDLPLIDPSRCREEIVAATPRD